MPKTAPIAVAVSGGVDSLYALMTLVDAGHEVAALHCLFRDPEPQDDPLDGLAANCARLGVPLWVEDVRKEFSEAVVRPFAHAYAEGLTPNPCALCNARMKFGLMFDRAIGRGAVRMATGHYAHHVEHPVYGRAVGRAADSRKDQSYFLALVPKDRLMAAQFPLASVTKDEARQTLAERGLTVPIPKESQEICFVPNDDYRALLTGAGEALSGPGNIVLAHDRRIVGRHGGLWRYTEGQRHGLGVAWSEPLYVIGKDRERNELLVDTKKALAETHCRAGQVNFLVPPELWNGEVFVRTRYRQQAVPAQVKTENGRLDIEFAEAQRKAAPGQVAAVYDESGILLAGGIII